MNNANQSDPLAQSTVTEDQLLEQVAYWLVKMNSDDCTDADRSAFAAWQQQDPKRVAQIAALQQTLGYFQQLQHSPSARSSAETLKQITSQTPNNTNSSNNASNNNAWQSYALALLLSLSILLALTYSGNIPLNQWTADHKNNYQAWSSNTLSDLSEIQMSGKTAYDLDFDSKQRLIKLYRGNILVEVAKDAQRPFVIQTQYAQITALGTRFIVQESEHATVLIMLESKTKITTDKMGTATIVHAGQQVLINQQGIISTTTVSPDLLEAAWQKHKLVIQNMPLDQVLGLLQNYQSETLVYDAAQLSKISVNATLTLDEHALDLLEKSLPIKVERALFNRVKVLPMQAVL